MEQRSDGFAGYVRIVALVALGLHAYVHYYGWFHARGLTDPRLATLLNRFDHTMFFRSYWFSYAVPIGLLLLAAIGERARKSEKITWHRAATLITGGSIVYVGAAWSFEWLPMGLAGQVFGAASLAGWFAIWVGLVSIKRVLGWDLQEDMFNEEGRSFPQEERLVTTKYSVNLPMSYRLGDEKRRGWINVVNPFRGSAVMGTPGSGKSYAFIKPFIRQTLDKGFCAYVYDFKFPELTEETYNAFLRSRHKFDVTPSFYVINFDDLRRSHRCNPLNPAGLTTISDAIESAQTILLNMNRTWVKKQGEFFIESPVNFLTSVIWYLKVTEGGRYCTLPHVIEFLARPYDKIFPAMGQEHSIRALIAPFVSALEKGAIDQLEGMIASVRIPMSRITGEQIYWVLTGDDFSLDLNNPEEPKVLCVGNNQERQMVYGTALGLINSRVARTINRPGRLPCAVVVDEIPSIYMRELDNLIATGRSNLIATLIAFQDMSQLVRDYGQDVAKVVYNTCANVFAGQVRGETATNLAGQFGKTVQVRRSLSQNKMDTSFSRAAQLEERIPASRIASLSQGEFVGIVADEVGAELPLKVFDAKIALDDAAIKRERASHKPLPYFADVTPEVVTANYRKIGNEVDALIERQLSVMPDGVSV